mmetsp:Transcript_70847/g.139127  ORF Transcript_70847/g.139127 Transcript_70847/m.139127 type:complete len:110 (+) Transcript_70847:702-1031(+)
MGACITQGRQRIVPIDAACHALEERQHGPGQVTPQQGVLWEVFNGNLVDIVGNRLREQDGEDVEDHEHENHRPHERPEGAGDGEDQRAQRPNIADDANYAEHADQADGP